MMAGTSAFACGSIPPGTVLPPGMVPPTSNAPSQSDIELVEGLRAGTLTLADRQRAIELLMREFEQELRSATLAPAELERARELQHQVRLLLERGEVQLALNAGDEFRRLVGHIVVPLQCGAPPVIAPAPATTAASPAN